MSKDYSQLDKSSFYSERKSFQDDEGRKDKNRDPIIIPHYQKNVIDENNFEQNKSIQFTEKEIQEAFNTLDLTKNNCITKDELSLFMKILNINANDEEIEQMINLADKQKNNKVKYEEFREMAQGNILSPIGVAFPPTLSLLENKNINFQNLPNNQYEKIIQNHDVSQYKNIEQKRKKIYEEYEQELKGQEKKLKQNNDMNDYQNIRIKNFEQFFKLLEINNDIFKNYLVKMKEEKYNVTFVKEQEFLEFFDLLENNNKNKSIKYFRTISQNDGAINLQELFIVWIAGQEFSYPNKCYLSFYVMDYQEKGRITFDEAVKIITWLNFLNKSKLKEEHMRKIFKILKLNTDIYINIALFEKIIKNFSQNLFTNKDQFHSIYFNVFF